MTPQRLRWGMLGTGGIAGIVADDIAIDGGVVTAVGSRSLDRGRRFAADHGIRLAVASAEALVADQCVDAVHVATPHSLHAEHALLAIAARKHVMIEKPLALNAREGASIAEAAEAAGVVVLEAMWSHYLPHLRRIRELLRAGVLGTVHAVTALHEQRLSPALDHRLLDPSLGGGALLDLGCYPVWFAHSVLGEPDEVQASSTWANTGVDSATAAVLATTSGAHATIRCDLDAAGPNTATVTGTTARIEIDRVWYTPTSFRLIASDGTIEERFDGAVPGRGRQFQARALEDRAHGGDEEVHRLEDSIAVLRTMDRIRDRVGLRYPSETVITGPR